MSSQPRTPAPYVHIGYLAKGGMGSVDVVMRQEGEFRRLYALKRLHPHLRDDTRVRAMFLEEARIAGLLNHPNIVGVLDVGEDDDGPYLVMNHVEGIHIGRLLKATAERAERVPMQVCLRIAIQIASGLQAAHSLVDHDGRPLKLVHRDLSPQNILIAFSGAVQITDFGIAKALGSGSETTTGVLKGKLSYMSPEQLTFEDVDERSDLFALGVVIYELFSGSRLYGGKDATVSARRICREPPPDLGEVRRDAPNELVQLLFELLAKKAEKRPANAATVRSRLEKILSDLLAEEEALPVGVYLAEVASDLMAESRTRLESGIRTAAALDTSATRTLGPKSRSRLSIPLVTLLVLLIAAGAGGFLWTQYAPANETDGVILPTAASEHAEVRGATPPTAAEPTEETAQETTVPVPVENSEGTESPDSEETASTAEQTARPTMRRGHRGARNDRMHSGEASSNSGEGPSMRPLGTLGFDD